MDKKEIMSIWAAFQEVQEKKLSAKQKKHFDKDNDGDIDWVLANGQGEGNTVYLNNGQGLFTLTDVLGHYDSRAVAFGDIDRV